MSGRKLLLAFHRIPLLELRLWVSVADHSGEFAAPFAWGIGKGEDIADACGACIHNRSRYALVFERAHLSHQLIAHEIFHCTHRMLEFRQQPFRSNNPEIHAMLQGHLAALVYGDLRRWQLFVPVRSPEASESLKP